MPVEETILHHSGLDPIVLKEVRMFNHVDFLGIQNRMDHARWFDGHAIATHQKEMRGLGKSANGSLDHIERRLDKRPLSPATFNPLGKHR